MFQSVLYCRVIGTRKFALCVIGVHLLSWSSAYCLSRTLANSTETALVTIGSYLLLQAYTADKQITHAYKSTSLLVFSSGVCLNIAIVVASVSAFCRPTSVLIWVR